MFQLVSLEPHSPLLLSVFVPSHYSVCFGLRFDVTILLLIAFFDVSDNKVTDLSCCISHFTGRDIFDIFPQDLDHSLFDPVGRLRSAPMVASII